MGIYYFAVDYEAQEQMWAPGRWSDSCIYFPCHPLPSMIAMKNTQGCDFQIVNDVSTVAEHAFKDVTEEVYQEFKNKFPNFDWKTYEELLICHVDAVEPLDLLKGSLNLAKIKSIHC